MALLGRCGGPQPKGDLSADTGLTRTIGCLSMRRVGLGLVVVGALAFVVALLADLIGLSDDVGFQIGPRQAGGMVLGLLVVLLGALILRRSRTS